LPADNPSKHVLRALSYRIGATSAAAALAIPIEPITGLDAIYDIVVSLALIWYWFTFFRDRCSTFAWGRRNRPTPDGVDRSTAP
jgi:hypothetical protein